MRDPVAMLPELLKVRLNVLPGELPLEISIEDKDEGLHSKDAANPEAVPEIATEEDVTLLSDTVKLAE